MGDHSEWIDFCETLMENFDLRSVAKTSRHNYCEQFCGLTNKMAPIKKQYIFFSYYI